VIAMFPLGRIVATPGALRALERANQTAACFLARHAEEIGANSIGRMCERTSTAWPAVFDC